MTTPNPADQLGILAVGAATALTEVVQWLDSLPAGNPVLLVDIAERLRDAGLPLAVPTADAPDEAVTFTITGASKTVIEAIRTALDVVLPLAQLVAAGAERRTDADVRQVAEEWLAEQVHKSAAGRREDAEVHVPDDPDAGPCGVVGHGLGCTCDMPAEAASDAHSPATGAER